MEACVGCGIVTKDQHPMVGIGRLDLDANGVDDEIAAHPVCEACWKDPEHRTLRPLKVSFFYLKDKANALGSAKASDRASKIPGMDIGIGH